MRGVDQAGMSRRLQSFKLDQWCRRGRNVSEGYADRSGWGRGGSALDECGDLCGGTGRSGGRMRWHWDTEARLLGRGTGGGEGFRVLKVRRMW